MTSAVKQRSSGRAHLLGQVGRLLVVITVVTLAVVGVGVAAWQIREGAAGGSGSAAVGEAVETSYGSFTVTRARKTFVPDTQGPPTVAQHAGTNGADQLQVWVRFVNTQAQGGVRYDPRRLRLVHAGSPGHIQPVAGSTLAADRLRGGSSIDGQVWFDLADLPAGRYFVEYAAPGDQVIRVALGRLEPRAVTEELGHQEHQSGGSEDERGHRH